MVKVDMRTYYVSSKLAGQVVALRVDARERCLQILYPQLHRSSLPLKGVYERSYSSQDYVELMQREASTQHRLLALQKRHVHPSGGSSP
jgi:hypothetical protein